METFVAEPRERKVGRPAVKPSVNDPAAIELLCERLISGKSMLAACEHPGCPLARAVYTRMAKDPEFFAVIARAREAQQHAIIDQTVDMADAATPETWQVVRLQIWARQWRAAKLAPRIYGDKVAHDHRGEIVHTTPEQRRRAIERLERRLGRHEPVTIEGQAREPS